MLSTDFERKHRMLLVWYKLQPKIRMISLEALMGSLSMYHGATALPDETIARWKSPCKKQAFTREIAIASSSAYRPFAARPCAEQHSRPLNRVLGGLFSWSPLRRTWYSLWPTATKNIGPKCRSFLGLLRFRGRRNRRRSVCSWPKRLPRPLVPNLVPITPRYCFLRISGRRSRWRLGVRHFGTLSRKFKLTFFGNNETILYKN